jgi:AcrR family transcriptional regulator
VFKIRGRKRPATAGGPTATRRKPKTRWGDKAARRRDILDAARALLERSGYQAFNMRDVARDAGVTAGTLYTYFANKEELFGVLYAERLERFHAEVAPLCAAAVDLEQLFVEVADRYRDVYRVFGRELNVWALVLEQPAAQPQLVLPLAQAALATLAAVQGAIDRIHAAPVGAVADGRRLAVPLLWATLQGLCDHFIGARHRLHGLGWDEMTRYAAQTLARGLGAGAAPRSAAGGRGATTPGAARAAAPGKES